MKTLFSPRLPAPTAPAPPVSTSAAPSLATIVITQGLRYWLLAAWALALAACAGWGKALAWLAAGVTVGLLRGRIERALVKRRTLTVGAELTLIATLTSAVWAFAPVLTWRSGAPFAEMAATTMLISGYLLVITQFRHLPRRAAIVSAPYGAVLLWIGIELVGRSGFWAFAASLIVAASALLTNIFFSRVHKAQIDAFQAEQARLIQELELARDHADDANRAKSTFLAMISHELRTPMNGILGGAQLLDVTQLNREQQTFVTMIRESGDSLLALLNDVLDFAKIEVGRLELETIPVPLETLVNRVRAIWTAKAQDKGLQLSVDFAPGTPTTILGDPTRLSQVVHNLVSNAIKFTPSGEVAVRVSGGQTPDDPIVIAVRDSGPGISQDDLGRLFKAFSQVDVSSTRKFGGTGLGLAISHNLAELMGGKLEVVSIVGDGSTFTFSFPARAAPDAVMSDAPQDPDNAPATTPRHVLVVEDHPVNRQILELWLAAQGHSAKVAEHGALALDLAAAERFDVVLMDVNMPVMDGLTAVRQLRALEGPNRHAPVVMLSASARDADHAAGFKAGANFYLDKPIDLSALQRLLNEGLDGR